MKPYYDAKGITVFLGNCLDVLPTLDAVDHVITDPPYSAHTHAKQWVGAALTKGRARFTGPGAHKELGFDSLTAELRDFVAERCGTTPRWSLVFSDIEGATDWRMSLEGAGLEYIRTGIWVKPDAAPQFTGDRPGSGAEAIVIAHPAGRKRWNGGGKKAVFSHCINDFGRLERPHPTTKPLSLMLELTALFTDPDDLILDPFMGSGTTLVAAKQLGRRAIGVELEEKWAEAAVKRLEATTPPLFVVPSAKPEQASMAGAAWE